MFLNRMVSLFELFLQPGFFFFFFFQMANLVWLTHNLMFLWHHSIEDT